MELRRILMSLLAGGLIFAGGVKAFSAENETASFESAVAPVLVRHCLSCHNAAEARGGLDLTRRSGLLKGGDSGPALIEKDPEGSLLLQRIVDGEMPPAKDAIRPSGKEIASIRKWIREGAEWPAGHVLSVFDSTTDRRAGRDWWSLQPVERPVIPPVGSADRVTNPIDALLLRSLESRGLSFSADADRRTWLRRVTLDLLGLPPTLEEVDDFLNDRSPGAEEKVVDRLLASPRMGERWGRHWLDVVRFTESDGFEQDKFRPHAWRYRDYVIDALNADRPYGDFIRDQLAGDAGPNPSRGAIVATGFLVAGSWDEIQNVGASVTEKSRAHEEQMEELIGAISQTFLGLTVNCARCHDHKFDPIRQSDYYAMKAVFDGVDHSLGKRDGNQPVFSPAEKATYDERRAPLLAELDTLTKQIATVDAQLPDALTAENENGPFVAEGRFGLALNSRKTRAQAPSKTAFQSLPLTVECWVKCENPGTFNVFVAQNDKSAGDHWEIYSFAGKGDFSVFLPGFSPNTIRSDVAVADGQWHFVALRLEERRVRLHVDGRLTADAAIERRKEPSKPGHLWIGGYGPQNIGCVGLIDDVRISRIVRDETNVPESPLTVDGDTLALWQFEEDAGGRFENKATSGANADPARLTAQLKTLNERRKAVESKLAALTPPLAYVGHRRQPPPTHVLKRGDIGAVGELVVPQGLTHLSSPKSELGLTNETPESERRRRFADWLTDPRHPLTARVGVNRIWQWHFGRGLVETPSDFGFHAGRPSHPELLDWLAAELIESGGSLKRIHRLIVTSTAYRQSAASEASDVAARKTDADNRLLWRFAPRRLEGEVVRDAMLAVSGELNDQIGGPSFQPWKVTVFNTHFYHLFDSGAAEFNRRTVYRANVITGRDPFLDAVDCPSPAVAAPERRNTVTPLQSLALMNDTFVQRQAERFAARIRLIEGDDVARCVARAVETAFGRPATETERRSLTQLAESDGLAQVCWTLLNSSEFLFLR